MVKTRYRIKHHNNKYLLQRRMLFVKWITIAEYENFYMANMVLNAFSKD